MILFRRASVGNFSWGSFLILHAYLWIIASALRKVMNESRSHVLAEKTNIGTQQFTGKLPPVVDDPPIRILAIASTSTFDSEEGRLHRRPVRHLRRSEELPPYEHSAAKEWLPTLRLDQQIPQHVSLHVRQAKMAALELVSQPSVVDAQAVQKGRVQVVHVDRIVHYVVAELVGLAVG